MMRRMHARSASPAQPAQPARRVLWPAVAVGLLCGGVASFPAAWVAQGLASASNGQVLLTDAQGSLWQGHARLVLSAGAGSRDAIALPGQVHWSLRPHGLGLKLDLSSDCCSQGATQILIQPGWRQTDLHVQGAEGAEARWQLPSSLLAGLGTPFNTLKLQGDVRWQSQGWHLSHVRGGGWIQSGGWQLELNEMRSAVSPLPILGSYQLRWTAQPDASARIELQSQRGPLLLQGQGEWRDGRTHFQGSASAEEGAQENLNNLLNIIGRREGARSVITLG